MAYLEARANIARAGVTYAGFAAPRFRVYIATTDRTAQVVKEPSFVITDTLDDTPSTLRARVKGVTESTAPSGDGLAGIYYDNITGTSPNIAIDTGATHVHRTDTTINFTWGAGVPVDGISADTFGVIWSGYLKALYSETYTIYINSDDGSKFFIDTGGGLTSIVSGNWQNQAATERSGTVALTAGEYYPIEVHFYDNTGDATMQLSWASASQTKQIIPQSCLFTSEPSATSAWAPAVGDAITVLYCTPDEYLFRGTILRVTTQVQAGQPPWYDIEAADYAWHLQHQGAYGGRYKSVGFNTVVADLMTAAGAGKGHVPSSLGNVAEMRIEAFTPVGTTLTRLAKLVGGYWRLVPRDLLVDLFVPGGDEDGNRPTLTNSSTVRNLRLVRDGTQLRNNTIVIGSGGDVTTPAQATNTSLTVSEVGWYSANSMAYGLVEDTFYQFNAPAGSGVGTVNSIYDYNGLRVGLRHDVPEGTLMRTVAAYLSTSSALTYGVLQHTIPAWDLSADAVNSLAALDVGMYGFPLSSLRYTTDARWVRVGQYVGASITAPTSVTGTFVIQRVTTTPRVLTTSLVSLDKTVEAGAYHKELSALLARVS